jgi:hypothetical protein
MGCPPLRRFLVPIVLTVLIAAACGGKSNSTRVTVVLFDLSGSTNAEAIRQQYTRDFAKILDVVSAGGIIAADVIDDNPLAHSTYPINESFDRYDPLKENKLDHDRRVRQKREAVLKEAEVIVRRRPSGRLGSNVLDGLQLAERVFLTFEGEHKLLVIFSDMVEQSKAYDFSADNLTTARISQIINRERSAGRLPDLRRVEVCVVGAGAATSGGLSAEKLLALREFWFQYFKAAGASLPKERYGSALLKCP